MTDAMTPDTRMVTDREVAAWLSWLDGVAPKPQITVQGMLRAQLADRVRLLEFVTWASAEWPKHMTAEEVLVKIKVKARELLKEAHGE